MRREFDSQQLLPSCFSLLMAIDVRHLNVVNVTNTKKQLLEIEPRITDYDHWCSVTKLQ